VNLGWQRLKENWAVTVPTFWPNKAGLSHTNIHDALMQKFGLHLKLTKLDKHLFNKRNKEFKTNGLDIGQML